MAFFPLQLFLKQSKAKYNISKYNIDIYHNDINVFHFRKGYTLKDMINKRNKYFLVNPKIIACINLIMLSVTGKLSLSDSINKYIPEFSENKNFEDLIISYIETSEADVELEYLDLISTITRLLSGYCIEECSDLMIIKPMNLNSTMFRGNEVTTTLSDYNKFCKHIYNYGNLFKKHIYLKNSIEILAHLTEKTQSGYLSHIDKNGSYTLIDPKSKTLVIYNQQSAYTIDNQYEMFDELQTLIHDCLKNIEFSKGVNLFP